MLVAAMSGIALTTYAEHPEPITNAPAGKTVEYTKKGMTYTVAGYDPRHIQIDGKTGSAIWTEGNEVFFKDFMLSYDSKYYIKGRVVNDKVIVDFPQTIMSYDWQNGNQSGTDWRLVQLLEKTAEADPNDYIPFPIYQPVADNNCIIFDIVDDTLVMQQTDNNFIVGITTDTGTWAWEGDYDTTWTPFNDNTVQKPSDDAQFDLNWEMLASGNGRDVTVAFENDTFWVSGFSKYLPESWAKGTINNDKITFESGQYLGIDSEYSHTCYFIGATIEEVNGEYMFVRANDIAFDYDKDAQQLSSKGSFLVNSNNTDHIYYLEAFQQPIFRKKRTVVESYVPQNPILIQWLDPDPAYAPLSSFTFELPRISVKDDLLDTSKLYFRIFTNDGAPFTFYPDEYTSIVEPTEDIAWSFNDNFDIVADGTYHVVYFQTQGVERIGVQSVYIDNNNEYTSEIVYTTGGNGVANNVADSNVVSTEMFDLQGRRVANPEKGIYIVRELRDNGTYSSRKVVRL